MTKQPLVSILIPSLRRFDQLLKSVDSFYATADDPDNFEVIVRLHHSDDESFRRMEEIERDGLIVFVGRDKKPGEGNAFLWNELAELAKGDWHQYWSDDMTIHGQGWDTLLSKIQPNKVIVHPEIHRLNTSIYLDDEGGPVPFVPSDAFQSCGYNEMPNVPDLSVNEILRDKFKWPVKFLEGIGVYHSRRVDSTLPVSEF